MADLILPAGAKSSVPKAKKAEEAPSIDSLTPEEQERLAARAEQEDFRKPVATAFVIIQERTGEWSLSPNLDLDIVQDRIATMSDIIAGTEVVQNDIQSTVIAQKAMTGMMQASQAMMRQAQEAQMLQSLGNVRG